MIIDDDKRFDSIEALKQQIELDIGLARSSLDYAFRYFQREESETFTVTTP